MWTMERSRSYQDETLKQDLTLYISNSINLGCKCILALTPRTLRPNASSSLRQAISNHPPSPRPLPRRNLRNCQLLPNPNTTVSNRNVNATTLYTQIIGEHGHITFTEHFKYLGSYCSYSLKDDYDIAKILSQASSAMGALNHFWADPALKTSVST